MRPIEMIVCRDEAQAKAMRALMRDRPEIRVVSPRLSQIRGIAPHKIAVCANVDLNQQIDGEGRLGDLLRRRQMVWGDDAIFIVGFDPVPFEAA